MKTKYNILVVEDKTFRFVLGEEKKDGEDFLIDRLSVQFSTNKPGVRIVTESHVLNYSKEAIKEFAEQLLEAIKKGTPPKELTPEQKLERDNLLRRL